MIVSELIAILQEMPETAEVIYNDDWHSDVSSVILHEAGEPMRSLSRGLIMCEQPVVEIT